MSLPLVDEVTDVLEVVTGTVRRVIMNTIHPQKGSFYCRSEQRHASGTPTIHLRFQRRTNGDWIKQLWWGCAATNRRLRTHFAVVFYALHDPQCNFDLILLRFPTVMRVRRGETGQIR